MSVIRKTTQQCIVAKESITYYSACTLRARRGPDIDAHFIHLLVIRLLPSLVSLSSPLAQLVQCLSNVLCQMIHVTILTFIGLVLLFRVHKSPSFLRTVVLPYIRYWRHIALVMPWRESEWLEVLCICRDRNLKPRSLLRSPSAHVPRRCRCDE